MSTRYTISTIEEFFAHALAIEREAATRYRELAGLMHVHHNGACAALFDWLAELESEHTATLQSHAAARSLSQIEPSEYRWPESTAPESASMETAHDLITPRHVLEVALNNERRAKAFFEGIAVAASDPDLRKLAAQFAAEEQQHIELIADVLQRESGSPGPAHDVDPAP